MIFFLKANDFQKTLNEREQLLKEKIDERDRIISELQVSRLT